jgi:folate-dependent phosphoribosylglycinamide formyltransferase PurN
MVTPDSQLGSLGPVAGPKIRVVLFGGGPIPERGVKEFVCRLEEHVEIDFLGAFCQSRGQTTGDIVRDVWKRRRLLAVPVLLAQIAAYARQLVTAPRSEYQLRKRFSRLADRTHFVPDIHAPEVLDSVRALDADLGLVYGSPILKPALFEIPTLGSLGIHHGRMPEYRGKKTTFWEMASGEESAGVTIQKINAGLDSGEIVKQGSVPIGRKSYHRVSREVEELGLDLYMTAVLETKQGTATLRPTPPAGRKPFRDPKVRDLIRYYRKRLIPWE